LTAISKRDCFRRRSSMNLRQRQGLGSRCRIARDALSSECANAGQTEDLDMFTDTLRIRQFSRPRCPVSEGYAHGLRPSTLHGFEVGLAFRPSSGATCFVGYSGALLRNRCIRAAPAPRDPGVDRTRVAAIVPQDIQLSVRLRAVADGYRLITLACQRLHSAMRDRFNRRYLHHQDRVLFRGVAGRDSGDGGKLVAGPLPEPRVNGDRVICPERPQTL